MRRRSFKRGRKSYSRRARRPARRPAMRKRIGYRM